jgi:hypothetical protein
LHTLLDPKIQVLVLYDIVRWVELNKMAHFSNTRNVIFPNADDLIAALCEYGQPKIIRASPPTVQVTNQSRQDRSQSIVHFPMHQAEGSLKKNSLISVASPPREDSHIAFERMDMFRDHTLEEGEISEYEVVTSNEARVKPEKQLKSGEEGYSSLDHEGVPNNEAETDSDGGCKHEDEKDNAPHREATEFSDEPEQYSSPVSQSRVNSANGVATLQVLGFAVGKELIVHLPDITAFHFSKQHIEDFYPVRLQIGVCDDSKIGTLSYLWIYLKWTKPSPQVDYIISGTVSARDANLVTEPSNEARRSIPHGQLCGILNENKAELYPVFRHFGTQRQELQALAKYGYVLAAESDDFYFSNHNIPMNLTFETHLQKVCRKFRSEPVDYWNRDFNLSVQPREKDRDRSNRIGQFAAIDAEFVGHTNHSRSIATQTPQSH